MRDVEKRIFECSIYNYKECPVAKKFKENNEGERPIPEAYLGNPKSKFMIIGINPGASKNYLSPNFKEYQDQIKWPISEQFRQYHYVTEIFGYPPLKEGGGIITNLVHCPTPIWTRPKDKKWWLSDAQKQKSIELCSPFCFKIIEEVDPELILLHKRDVVEFFSRHCKWGISENAKNKDIHGLIKRCNDRIFVLLARHLASIRTEKDETWEIMKEAAKKLKKE